MKLNFFFFPSLGHTRTYCCASQWIIDEERFCIFPPRHFQAVSTFRTFFIFWREKSKYAAYYVNILYLNFPFLLLSLIWIVLNTNCYWFEMSLFWIVLDLNCLLNELSVIWIVLKTNCPSLNLSLILFVLNLNYWFELSMIRVVLIWH